jgi:alkanesulfonate monooxygenase SsuD/methylene tetrahydromethanopterin reductase-like flavin-dependent oxidoreductase (luciferase family)
MTGSPVGALIPSTTPPEKIADTATLAEELGFGAVWVAEECYAHGGFTAAATALAATRHIPVGLGIVPSVVRHPAITAMEIATLARMHPGRFLPGIGHGVSFLLDQMDLTPKSSLGAFEECVTAVTRLLAGETLDVEGEHFTFHSVTLTHPPTVKVPILAGVVGPKSLRLSGRIADGTVMSVLASAKYIEQALGHIREGMTSGRRSEHDVPAFALSSVDNDGPKAKQAARATLAFYLAAVGPQNPLIGTLGYGDQLARMLRDGGMERLAREMPDEWVDDFTVSGDPDEVTDQIRALLAAGATSVVLVPVDPSTAMRELQLVADTVLPRIR